MQIKKIITAAAASLMALSAATFSVFADENATLCFDTDAAVSMVQAYGSATETGFSTSIDEQTKSNGNGSLMLSENVTESIAEDKRSGGVYFESSSFELDSFAGCTVTMKVMFDKNAAKLAESFSVFSDGIVWMTYDVSNQQAGQWVDVALTIPENADNTRIGFTIPVFEAYNGAVAYIDDLTITTDEGTAIANIGDQKESSKIEVSIGKTSRIILLVVVCVIIIAVIAGVGFIISKFQNRFTE